MHLKRQKVPKNWPVHRKGTTFVVRPKSNIEKGIPILVILRDILGIAQNRREVKKAIHEKNILLNNKPVTDERNAALLFDIIAIVPSKKYYRLEISDKGKFKVEEINKQESLKKTAKIIGKKALKGRKMQLNLSDGRNILSNIKCKVNDSVLVDLQNKKVEKCLPLVEKSKVLIFEGKHAGEKGVVNRIDEKRRMVELTINKNKVNVLIKQLMVIE